MFMKGDKVVYAHPIPHIFRLKVGEVYTVDEYYKSFNNGPPAILLRETGNIYRPQRFEHVKPLPPMEYFL